MPSDTKLQMLTVILKHKSPSFRATLFGDLALPRQNVRYHLTQMVEEGILKKVDRDYIIFDRDLIIDSIASSAEPDSRYELPHYKSSPFLNDLKAISSGIRTLVYLKTIRAPHTNDFSKNMNDLIDSDIKRLKQLKRFLNGKQYSIRTASRKLYEVYDPNDYYILYNTYTKLGVIEMDSADWCAKVRALVYAQAEGLNG